MCHEFSDSIVTLFASALTGDRLLLCVVSSTYNSCGINNTW